MDRLDLSLNGHDTLAAVCSQIDNLSVVEQHFDTLHLDGLVGGRGKAELRLKLPRSEMYSCF